MSLAKYVSVPLALTAAASAKDAAIQKKIYRSGITTPIISNKEVKDIMKMFKSLKVSGLLIKDVSVTNENEAKEHKGGFLSNLNEFEESSIPCKS